MIGGAKVTVTCQAELLALSRSSLYYTPRTLSDRDLRLMRRLDEPHLRWAFFGSRKLTRELQKEGHKVRRRHVVTRMRRMGIEAVDAHRHAWHGRAAALTRNGSAQIAGV